VGNSDRRVLEQLRGMDGAQLGQVTPSFADARLEELFFRYRARNFADSLTEEEFETWQAHCAQRLYQGKAGALTLDAFFNQLNELGKTADAKQLAVLQDLNDYAQMIAPEPLD
jgi:exodeoxyribonuclease-1